MDLVDGGVVVLSPVQRASMVTAWVPLGNIVQLLTVRPRIVLLSSFLRGCLSSLRDGQSASRREAVALLSGVAAALAGLTMPAAVRTLGMTAVEAADEALVGSLCGVS